MAYAEKQLHHSPLCYEPVTKPEQLAPGKYYFVQEIRWRANPEIVQCGTHGDRKYLGNRVWASEDNLQAFRRWKILGPVPVPDDIEFNS